ncbi:hypothetical protein [uncultured Brevundimonas sp.]|uniref:hypothetical protein n=1 Tax=uncultured Brevundimonas sp. TaxID=213418 RepID=UPI002626764C|nr:hypothetical protein [uncultured Brevundimonas sp.]
MTSETEASQRPDLRPGIAICMYDADPAWDMVENLSGDVWSPAGARTVPVSATDPDLLVEILGEYLRNGDCRAVLLVGRTQKCDGFRLQMRAENRALDRKDRLSLTGPGIARTTAPVADILRALAEAGIAAKASSEAEDDVGSYLLYRILVDLVDGPHTPAVGLLRVPAPADENTVKKGVKAAASVMAGQMALLPRV